MGGCERVVDTRNRIVRKRDVLKYTPYFQILTLVYILKLQLYFNQVTILKLKQKIIIISCHEVVVVQKPYFYSTRTYCGFLIKQNEISINIKTTIFLSKQYMFKYHNKISFSFNFIYIIWYESQFEPS